MSVAIVDLLGHGPDFSSGHQLSLVTGSPGNHHPIREFFPGTTQDGQWSCQSPLGELCPQCWSAQTINDGMVDGNTVSFDIDGGLLARTRATVT